VIVADGKHPTYVGPFPNERLAFDWAEAQDHAFCVEKMRKP
jgi:hypothetical protein